MKILHITSSYFGQNSIVGGGERYTYELARYMAARCDSTLLSFGEKYEEFNDGLLKVKIYPASSYLNKNKADPIPSNLAWVADIERADIVHIYQKRVTITGLAVQYARHFGRKIFVTDLGSGGNDLFESLSLTREIDGWLPISQFGTNFLPPGVQARTRVIYGGINTDFFQPIANTANKQPNRVCYVGRLLPHKGIDILVRAVAPDMELHLIGRPYDPAYLQHLQELTRGKNVKFIFEATDQTILDEYHTARVSVLASVYEDMFGHSYAQPELLGLVLLEAQSCGTPVVATNVASLPEVVNPGRTGLLVPPNNPEELGRALRQIMDLDPAAYNEMSLAARRWVQAKFGWPEVVERCLESYRAAYDYLAATSVVPFFERQGANTASYAPFFDQLLDLGLEEVDCYFCGAAVGESLGAREGLEVRLCPVCGLMYTSPRLPETSLSKLYATEYWHQRMAIHCYPSIEERVSLDYTLAIDRITEIQSFKSAGKFLDVGCSNGALIKRAREVGFEACGLEIAPETVQLAQQYSGCPVYQGMLENYSFPTASFDVITLFDAFEHLYDPRTALKYFLNWLKPGGLLVIETFRTNSPDFQAQMLDHEDVKPAEHIYMYTEYQLDQLFNEAGFYSARRVYPLGEGNSRIKQYLLAPQKALPAALVENCDLLFISNLYPPYYIGGYEVMCQDISEGLARLGQKTVVLTSRYGVAEPTIEGNILRLLEVDISNPGGESFRIRDKADGSLNVAIVRECIRRFNPKQVILFNIYGLNSLAILEVLEELHIPRLMHLCDYQLIPTWNRDLENINELQTKLLHPEMKLTAASQQIADFHITNGFRPETFQVIYNSLHPRLLEGIQVHKPNLAPHYSRREPFKILFAGRLNSPKGPQLLVEALISLVEEYGAFASLDLIGAGDAPYITSIKKKILEAEERLGFSLPIHWLGFRQRHKLFEVLHEYNAFGHSSTTLRPEPLGLVVLEAMAFGVPVVVSNSSGASEIIEDGVNGLLAKTDDANSFTAALWELYQNPQLCQEISQQSRKTILENHTSPRMEYEFLKAIYGGAKS